MDSISPEHRSWVMSRIGSKDTKPELIVRSVLHRLGYRFSLRRKLPGRPDIVMPKYNLVIFVHGCFWHQHRCQAGRVPKSNTAFWEEKFAKNKARDARVKRKLRREGWRVHTVWECELKKCPERLIASLEKAIHGKTKKGKKGYRYPNQQAKALLKVAEVRAAKRWGRSKK